MCVCCSEISVSQWTHAHRYKLALYLQSKFYQHVTLVIVMHTIVVLLYASLCNVLWLSPHINMGSHGLSAPCKGGYRQRATTTTHYNPLRPRRHTFFLTSYFSVHAGFIPSHQSGAGTWMQRVYFALRWLVWDSWNTVRSIIVFLCWPQEESGRLLRFI